MKIKWKSGVGCPDCKMAWDMAKRNDEFTKEYWIPILTKWNESEQAQMDSPRFGEIVLQIIKERNEFSKKLRERE